MAQAKLPGHYWTEVVATTAYLRNQKPTTSLKAQHVMRNGMRESLTQVI